jgi:hypothetical protein
MPPMRLGMKNTVRWMLAPFMFRVSASAMARAMTLISTVESTANAAVNQKEWPKAGVLEGVAVVPQAHEGGLVDGDKSCRT